MEEQELKNKIFSLYMLCLDENLPDRQKHVGQLWDLILRWNKRWNIDYRIKKSKFGDEVSDMGEEIYNVLRRFLGESRDNVPKNAEGFFNYLKTSLKNEAARLARNEVEFKVPRETQVIKKEIDEQIEYFEEQNERKPTGDEIKVIESGHVKTSEARKKYKAYKSLIAIHSLDSPKFANDENKETLNYLDQEETSNIHNFDGLLIPHVEYEKKHDPGKMSRLRDFVEDYLVKMEDDRDCFRAIFTLYCCVDQAMDWDSLGPVLDTDILDEYIQNEKTPFQYQIYLKYHDVTKDSAQSMASKMWKEFREKLNEWNEKERIFIVSIKENNP